MEIFRHPPGLLVLFCTEMVERFSYYGMRALLVLYMTKHLLYTQEQSSMVYGLYTSLVYLTPLAGGFIADRYIGQRKAVIVGAILMSIGHFLMAVESLFYPAMGFLVIGNGFFKPNISTQVGRLYSEGDPRRDGAFSIFYVGINVGAFFSPLICGTLGQKVGWHWGFGAAGVGMLIGLAIYMWGQKHLAEDTLKTTQAEHKTEKKPLTSQEKDAIKILVVLCAINIVFWAVYEQQGNTLQLWADENTNFRLFGWEMPSTWYQSFNPFMIAIFTPFILGFWKRQADRKSEPSTVVKMIIGYLLLGASFLIMIGAALSNPGTDKGSLLWLFVGTAVLTVGELYLSPVGLSLVTKVAPARMVSLLMGMWFLSSFFGNFLSGWLGTFYGKMPKGAFFGLLGSLAIASGFLILVFLKKLRGGLDGSANNKAAQA